jgi:hypothetical protein
VRVIQAPVKGVPDGMIPAEQRKDVPDFTLNDTQGRPVNLFGYKRQRSSVRLLGRWRLACHCENICSDPRN